MNAPSNSTGPSEELVAYLDGELPADSNRQMEQRLSDEPSLRSQLREYQQSWDLLDQLPRQETSENFTSTTVEMVALSAEHHAEPATAPITSPMKTHRHPRRGPLIAVALFSLLSGFVATLLLLPKKIDPLLDDLGVVQEMDKYQQIEGIDFLRKLQERDLFGEGDSK